MNMQIRRIPGLKVGTSGSTMDTAPGRRVALTMMGFGIAAGAAGLAALDGGVASAAEPSLPAGTKSLKDSLRT